MSDKRPEILEDATRLDSEPLSSEKAELKAFLHRQFELWPANHRDCFFETAESVLKQLRRNVNGV